jgi:uncharacterized OB-fold protein
MTDPNRFIGPGPQPLSDKEFRKGIGVDFEVDARYAWDAGIAIGHYLNELKEGKIAARVCYGCNRTLVPPRMFCEQCFRPTDAWTTVQDTGTVNTFSLAYITWDMRELTDPDIPAVIELDGASPGIGIMHKLGEVDPEAVHTGMRVRAVWKPEAQRTGSILDIDHWAPIGGRSAQRKPARKKAAARKKPAAKKAAPRTKKSAIKAKKKGRR